MTTTYKLSHSAKQDLNNIYTYGLERWGEKQADAYFNNFFKAFEIIAEQPERYPKAEEIRAGYRRCVCGVDSIYFRQKDKTIEIMAIIGHQQI